MRVKKDKTACMYLSLCLLLLLCIRSAHLKILGFPMGGAYQYRDIFAQFKTMQRKQDLASALGIRKKIGANHMHF